mmetsp:Transcript_28948/g.38451  ORF Transcript_28948/g.38451 Transcript_28948/m.38451 type:complete len:115 (+) Transcript_28948:22-366(+)
MVLRILTEGSGGGQRGHYEWLQNVYWLWSVEKVLYCVKFTRDTFQQNNPIENNPLLPTHSCIVIFSICFNTFAHCSIIVLDSTTLFRILVTTKMAACTCYFWTSAMTISTKLHW